MSTMQVMQVSTLRSRQPTSDGVAEGHLPAASGGLPMSFTMFHGKIIGKKTTEIFFFDFTDQTNQFVISGYDD